jgi:hypothetical protein
VSEYQYYGFLAIDRPLDAEAQAALRKLSSRAQITATTFTNEYNYSDFRGDPDALIERFFDVHVYSGFWQTRRFAMRLPKRLVDRDAIDAFMIDDEFMTIDDSGSDWIVQVHLNDMDFGYGDETGWLARLAPLRAAVLAGDLRFFYLLWLMQVGFDEFMRDDAVEPLPGIGPLDGALTAFAEFLEIDADLVGAAAATGASAPQVEPTGEQAAAFIRALPETERVDLLMRVYTGADPHVGTVLRRRVRDALCGEATMASRRTAGELRAASADVEAERKRREAERHAAAERKRLAEEALLDERRRALLRARGESVWREVDAAIERRNGPGYEEAVGLLLDLREITTDRKAFDDRLRRIRELHGSKRKFIERLDGAELQ